ncbi:MAG TPA: tetratricopeptide repeat protein, partial [Desulfosarcina sp.]|nr:tetratricopeptide repeat protein [Desulfosarcina sp.]
MKTLSEYLPGLRLAMMLIAVLALPAANAVSDDTPMTIDADRQYGYAQSRLDDDAFDEAVVAFNRFIYFFPEDPRVARARFQVGTAHFAARRYQEAAAVFERLTADYAGLPLENEAFFMLSRCRARQGLNAQAMLDLHNLLAVTTDANVADEARHALGWLQVDQGRWDQAFREFDHISSVNRSRYRVD